MSLLAGIFGTDTFIFKNRKTCKSYTFTNRMWAKSSHTVFARRPCEGRATSGRHCGPRPAEQLCEFTLQRWQRTPHDTPACTCLRNPGGQSALDSRVQIKGNPKKELRKGQSGKETLFGTALRISNQVSQTQKVHSLRGFCLFFTLGPFVLL